MTSDLDKLKYCGDQLRPDWDQECADALVAALLKKQAKENQEGVDPAQPKNPTNS